MSPPQQNTIEESWTAEPELADKPPRRIMLSEYPDLNQVNVMVYYALGGVLAAFGLVLFVLGLSGKNMLFIFGGIVLAGGGTALLVLVPQKQKQHLARAEHLVMNGIPVAARVLSSDNLTGDSTYGRAVKYQVTIPGGDMVHRSVNADERALPKRVPGNTTALIDINTGDVELYCALPFRAVAKNGQAVRAPESALDGVVTPVPTVMASTTDVQTAQAPTTGAGQFGDRLPSKGAGQFSDRLPSVASPTAATNGETTSAEPAAPPIPARMGTIFDPNRNDDEEKVVVVEEVPDAPKEPEAAPQTWE